MAKFDAVLFDFDGTVADTGEGVFLCVRHAIDVHSLEQPSEEEIRKFIGPPMIASYHNLYPQLSDSDVQSLMQSYRERYAAEGIYKFRLYDGMVELLQTLNENSIKVAVASSKPQEALTNIIKVGKIERYFDCIVGADKNYVDSDKAAIIKEAINRLSVADKSRILMVGDRKYDIVGAHKAGIPCAAVLFGYGSAEEFEEYHADYVVESCDEIAQLVIEK